MALISRTPDSASPKLYGDFRSLNRSLSGVVPSSNERGAVTATSRLKAVVRGNVALIGDASGSVDAITGEGLCQAFQQSEALVECARRTATSRITRGHTAPSASARPSWPT